MGLFDFGGGGGNAEIDTQGYRDEYDRMIQSFDRLMAERKPVIDNYEHIANQQLDALIGETVPASQEAFRRSSKYFKQWETETAPMISQFGKDAAGYDTPQRRAQERAKAMADVQAGSQGARESALASLERYGIDPSQTRGAALDANLRLTTALSQVQAAQAAEQQVEETGVQRRAQAIQLGSQLHDAATSEAQTGMYLGSNTINLANQTAGNFANIYGSPIQYLQAKRGLITDKLNAKIAEQASKSPAGGQGAAIGSTLGSAAGTAIGYYYGSGPVGGAIGGAIGGTAGGAIGGAFDG